MSANRSSLTYRPNRWTAWRRVGASLVGLALAANPHRAEAIAGWCTALGRAICIGCPWQAKRAIRQLVRLADLVEDGTRFRVTPAGEQALATAEVTPCAG